MDWFPLPLDVLDRLDNAEITPAGAALYLRLVFEAARCEPYGELPARGVKRVVTGTGSGHSRGHLRVLIGAGFLAEAGTEAPGKSRGGAKARHGGDFSYRLQRFEHQPAAGVQPERKIIVAR